MPATDASITAKLHLGLTSGVAGRAARGAIGAVMHHYDIEPLIAFPLSPLAANLLPPPPDKFYPKAHYTSTSLPLWLCIELESAAVISSTRRTNPPEETAVWVS